ncbi:MAG: DnaB-like helicase C-terminal domain-containing protein [Candidatus Nitrosotenuis sp.]
MDLEKQKLLLQCLLSSHDLFARCFAILKPDYFDPALKKSVAFAMKFLEQYHIVPKPEIIYAETGFEFEQLEFNKQEQKFVADEIELFCRDQAARLAIINAPKLMEKGDMMGVLEMMKEAVTISLLRDLGLDYFKNVETRLQGELENPPFISSGWKDVDIKLGGLERQTLLLFSANSGVGKSISMTNLTVNLLQQGLNGIYFTLEMSEARVAKRLDSMISGVGQADILKNIGAVANTIEGASIKMGNLYIKRMSESTTTANHLRAYLKEFEQTNGFIPDFIVVDYLDLMASTRNVSTENLFIKDKYVAEELRAIGFEYDCLIISASQLGRGAIDAEKITQAHVQGGISKVQTADAMIAIIQTETMKAAGEYIFEYLKTRNSDGVGKKTLLRWNPQTLRVTDVDVQPEFKIDNVKKDKPKLSNLGTKFNPMDSADEVFDALKVVEKVHSGTNK